MPTANGTIATAAWSALDATGVARATQFSRVFAFATFQANATVTATQGTAAWTSSEATVSLVEAAADPTVLRFRPEQPIRQRLEWQTDIHTAHNGATRRIAVYGAPRQTLTLEPLLVADAELREVQRTLYGELDADLSLPVWHEPHPLTAEASSGTSILSFDTTYADTIAAGDRLWVTTADDDTRELVTIATPGSGSVTIVGTLANDYPAGAEVYPTVLVQIPDRSGTQRALVNAGRAPIVATTVNRRLLEGTGGTVPTFNSLPILDECPIFEGPSGDQFDQRLEVLDYGSVRQRFTGQAAPEVSGARTFRSADAATWAFWKAFLDTVKGRQGAFYWPSYRPDLVVATQPAQGASTLTINDDADYVATRFPIQAMRSIMVRSADGGAQPFLVTLAVDNGNGTQTLTLNAALTNTALGSTVNQIELMPTARLASDTVEIEHFSTVRRIRLAITSEETPS